MSELNPPDHIPYKVTMNLVTEISKPTVDDRVPEVRDTHEASQDQAEEAADEKDQRRTEVKPLASVAFSFSSEDSEFNDETGQYASMQLCMSIMYPHQRGIPM